LQSVCFEIVGRQAYQKFHLKWFQALLRQDLAFFDVHGSNAIVASIETNSERYRNGIGKRFGDLFCSCVTCFGSLVFAFYASWVVALVVLGVLPLIVFLSTTLVKVNQSRSLHAANAYKRAGTFAASTVFSIRTLLSLNAMSRQIELYADATFQAYKATTSRLWRIGSFNGKALRNGILP
jgi:ATP-binding cassette subfamily B (MDR/TAP) protein 1